MKMWRPFLGIVVLAFCLAGCSTVSGWMSSSDSSSGSTSSSSSAKSSQPAVADNTYLASDDYKDDDEINGTFLKRADYAKMVNDYEYHGTEFDWGWSPGKISDDGDVQSLGFNIKHYQTIYLSPVVDDTHSFDKGMLKALKTGFHKMAKRLGLKVVSSKRSADLVMGSHVVDYNPNKTYAFFTWVNPFVEVETRLTDNHTNKPLLLLRDQNHAQSPKIAARQYVHMVYTVLR